jgi:CRP/FNR family cyclic AMP-dependent transcriptional regulator
MPVEKSVMVSVLREERAFSEMFMSHLLTRTIRVEADSVDQLFNSSEKRLAWALLLLATFGKEGTPDFMNKFPKVGLISYNGHIEIQSSLLNVVLHEQPHIER